MTHRSGGERRGRRGPWVPAVALATVVVLSAAVAACSEDRSDDSSTPGISTPEVVLCTQDDLLSCARESTIADLVPETETEATGEPVVIGMINQENTPAGSYPELSQATHVGVDFINDEMGGIDGRPIQLEVCNAEFSPEGSTSCAQQFVQLGVPVVLGGIDIFGTGVETLDASGIPFVGGIPVSSQSVESPNSFQWSGGIWGAAVAFAYHAATVDEAESVAIVYGDFGPIAQGAEYGRQTLEALGITDVQMIPHPIITSDLATPIQVAAESNPDAVFVLAADEGCTAAFDAVRNAGITATMYYVGACASPSIIEQAGTDVTEGARFNVEDEIDLDGVDPDGQLFIAASEKYGPEGFSPIGAGQVSFKSLMNLYAILRAVGGENLGPAAITAELAAQVDTPAYLGHPYTCDREQFAGLPAMCSPQQVVVELRDGALHQLGGWIDVGEIYPG